MKRFYINLMLGLFVILYIKDSHNLSPMEENKWNCSKYLSSIWDALRDLVPFVQFRKREKHPWKNVTFSKIAGASHIIKIQYRFSCPCK